MSSTTTANIDHLDDRVDEEIISCLSLTTPRSFFLFAGAGSGKTRSLVKALGHIRVNLGRELRLHNRRVAVITYTKAARDEIIRRTQFDPIIAVSTIHAFAWSVIEGFNHDIREWLRVTLVADIEELKAKEAAGRKGTKASAERLADIIAKTRRLEQLDTIRQFVYSPDTDNRGRDSLNHSEVLEITGAFIRTKPVMQNILKDGYPFILVDESQDTNRHIVDALFALQATHPNHVALGLFGDMMQRIYGDGKAGLGDDLPANWLKPVKQLNFRCPIRIIQLINKIREATDQQAQVPCSKATEGHVRMFILPAAITDKPAVEAAIRGRMAAITGDASWTSPGGSKELILEHRMAARRLGFDELFAALYGFAPFRTGLLDGTLPALTLFSGRVLPLIDAGQDQFAVARIVRSSSPLLSTEILRKVEDDTAQLSKAQAAVSALQVVAATDTATFGELLREVARTGLFSLPDMLRSAAGKSISSTTTEDEDMEEQRSARDEAVEQFLAVPFAQIRPYVEYVTRKARFDTHQGVKGLEFPRVLVIMDDTEARGFQFKYEKLFGGGSGEDATTAATRRLFYVTCSRAERSLCLVAYTDNPERVRKYVIDQGWFDKTEVEMAI
ncbi:UvrD-helicase domain-containing protein [Acidocella sp.]|uniref:UvrD-helicase domain-containing protein n=1 Tax=Acidocella sp. TaxID=50710 RepID=UPI00260861FF|nr:UvrD-helicase domain-containing protein [Acidocella sp.]